MTEHIEGDWKSFHFRMAQPSDYPNILRHMREHFYRDEPLCRHSGYEDAMADDFDVFVLDALSHNLSFVAVDKATNEIAGIRVTTVVHKGEHQDLPPIKTTKARAIIGILVKLGEEANLFEKYPEVDKVADFFMVSVGKNYRGQGLATEIYDRAVKMLEAKKFPLVKSTFSSPHTQRIGRKRGFEELGRIKFLDWKDDNGDSYYPNANEEECAIFMIKTLNA